MFRVWFRVEFEFWVFRFVFSTFSRLLLGVHFREVCGLETWGFTLAGLIQYRICGFWICGMFVGVFCWSLGFGRCILDLYFGP